MSFDTIIRGGTVVTAADTFASDVGIRGGKIVALGHDLGVAATIIDATDRLHNRDTIWPLGGCYLQ